MPLARFSCSCKYNSSGRKAIHLIHEEGGTPATVQYNRLISTVHPSDRHTLTYTFRFHLYIDYSIGSRWGLELYGAASGWRIRILSRADIRRIPRPPPSTRHSPGVPLPFRLKMMAGVEQRAGTGMRHVLAANS